MKKYFVDVYLPSVGEHFGVKLPAGKTVGEATSLLIEIVESLTRGAYKGMDHPVLLNADNGEPIGQNLTIYDAGIRNASRLLLI